jgi:hypothetical protein
MLPTQTWEGNAVPQDDPKMLDDGRERILRLLIARLRQEYHFGMQTIADFFRMRADKQKEFSSRRDMLKQHSFFSKRWRNSSRSS